MSKHFFVKASVVQVLTPFFIIHNFFGLFTMKVNSTKFRLSNYAIAAFVVNLLFGIYCIKSGLSVGLKMKSFKLLGFCVTIALNKGIICSVITIVLNFATRNHLRKLLKTLVHFDKLAKNVFNLNHRKEFILLLSFWTVKNLFLLIRSFEASKVRPRPPFLNVYITLNFYIVIDLCYIMLFLVSHRIFRLRKAFEEFSNINHSLQDHIIHESVKTFSVLMNQLLTCMNLISRSFGVQMMIFFAIASLMGLFAIFSGLEIIFNVASTESISIFNIFKYYAMFCHVFLILILDNFISCRIKNRIIFQIILKLGLKFLADFRN